MAPKILMISYYTPPIGTSGAVRVTKFAKYLKYFKWEPIILTTKITAYYHYDYTLLNDLNNIKIYRSETLDLGRILHLLKIHVPPPTEAQTSLSLNLNFLLYPDAKRFWIPFASVLGKKIVNKEKPNAIFATSPPFSTLIVGVLLKRKFEIPLIVDFRDPWPTGYKPPPKFLQKKLIKLRNFIINSADKVLVINDTIKEELNCTNAVILPNGYDPEEFDRPSKSVAKFSIVHAGNIVEVLESLILVANSIKDFKETKLVLVGPCPPDIRRKLQQFENIVCLGALSHQETAAVLSGASVLLYISKPNQAVGIKFYEYLGAKKPILVIGKFPKEIDVLLKKHSVGIAVSLNPKEIRHFIHNLILKKFTFSPINVSEYSYFVIVQKLEKIFKELLCLQNF
ncbi:MAG: hypothetical protein RMJ65_03375 [candidate division WOR-3 bacterium]|nr:hypothetical protein [candidate division WOR-3 bacterium]